jgi:hypothetical protein
MQLEGFLRSEIDWNTLDDYRTGLSKRRLNHKEAGRVWIHDSRPCDQLTTLRFHGKQTDRTKEADWP